MRLPNRLFMQGGRVQRAGRWALRHPKSTAAMTAPFLAAGTALHQFAPGPPRSGRRGPIQSPTGSSIGAYTNPYTRGY